MVARPAAVLRSMVDCYVGYRQHGVTLDVHRGLPSRAVTLVISLARPIKLTCAPGSEQEPRALRAAVAGLHLGPALIEQDGFQEGIHVCLSPLGVHRLLGVSAAELAGTVCDISELPVRAGHDLVDRLREVRDWPTRFAILDRQLAGGMEHEPVSVVGEVEWAWRQLLRHGGMLRVAELAEQVGWSRRHFSQRFTRAVGVSPKQAARLVRFERSTALVRAGAMTSLARLATECGYYDQAHLTNEWGQLAGCSPHTWIAEELPFLHDTCTELAADSVP